MPYYIRFLWLFKQLRSYLKYRVIKNIRYVIYLAEARFLWYILLYNHTASLYPSQGYFLAQSCEAIAFVVIVIKPKSWHLP